MKILLSLLAALALASAADLKLGKPLALKEPVAIATLIAKSGDYTGKPVQVKGKITAVCQMAGCWMNLADENGKMVRIKVEDGVIEFPKDAAGKMALAEGMFTKTELTQEQAIKSAKHEADEAGRKFDPKSVKGPVTNYTIHGTGAVILSN